MFESVNNIEGYDIDFFNKKNVYELQEFINESWREGHILSRNIDLLDWQYFDKRENRYNFVYARSQNTNLIDGIFGFIPTYHFDPNLNENRELWGAIWQIEKKRVNVKGLGSVLYKYVFDTIHPKTFANLGISQIAQDIYKRWGFAVSIFSQYYIPNYKTREFKIANFNTINAVNVVNNNVTIEEIYSLDSVNINLRNTYPVKSYEYFNNRYKNHPFYKYHFFMLINQGIQQYVLVTRVNKANDAKAMRIVDIIGEFNGLNIIQPIQKILDSYDCEYIDCLNFGISKTIFVSAGFAERNENDLNIVPHYFEPFIRQNIDIGAAVLAPAEYLAFKGDSDQDRPNM